jgi:hypothetical protein
LNINGSNNNKGLNHNEVGYNDTVTDTRVTVVKQRASYQPSCDNIHTRNLPTGMLSKYDATENHTTEYATTENHATGKPTVLKPRKFSSTTRSKISFTHEEASTAISEFSSTRPKISLAHEETSELSSARTKISFAHEEASSRTPVTSKTTCKVNEVTHITKSKIPEMIHTGTTKYAATENHVTEIPSKQSKISFAHEEASTEISEFPSTRPNTSSAHEAAIIKNTDRDKPPTVKFKINMVLNEGMNTKYTTAMEPSSYSPTPIIVSF